MSHIYAKKFSKWRHNGNVGMPETSDRHEHVQAESSKFSGTWKESKFKGVSKNEDDGNMHEFRRIFKEVERLGTLQMSWKERKAIETDKIVALGAKPQKSHKMPKSMGMDIKRKREKLEQQKLQEDLAFGLPVPKRRKKYEKISAQNRGLKSSGGVFKGGVLYVTPPQAKEEGKLRIGDIGASETRRGKGNSKKVKKDKKRIRQ